MASLCRWTVALALTALLSPFSTASKPNDITINDPSFKELLGPSPAVVELTKTNAKSDLYHEGACYHAPTKSLWAASDMVPSGNSSVRLLFRITGLGSSDSAHIEQINHTIPNPIGGVANVRNSPLGDVLLFAAQGTLADTPPGGVYAMNPYPPYNASLVLGSYGDYPFNSLDDITVTSDGVVWITDPPYGYGEGSRPRPILPNQVYAFDPITSQIRVVADSFGRPNGVAASLDGCQIYIGDTGASIGNNTFDFQGPRTIYVFDKMGYFLGNRRVFAMPQAIATAADGIKTDTGGNVWASVAGEDYSGVVVWDSDGTLLGSIKLGGTAGNLVFGEAGQVFVMGGDRIYELRVSKKVVGVGFEHGYK